MKTTIVLLATDEAALLERSLPAALAQDADAEVLLVDNASTDNTGELAARYGSAYLRLEPRRIYAEAINEGIAQAGGDAVLLLNPDCFLRPGFLSAALPRLSEDGVGAVAGKLLRVTEPGPAPDQIDAAGMFIDRRRKNGLVGFGRPSSQFSTPGEAFGADGAAALYRRETLADCALGGREVFDEELGVWASDADLAWRARVLGWRCVYEPRAVAEHIRTYSPATRVEMPEAARRIQFRNRYLMMIKNETRRSFLAHLPWIAVYEVLALGHVLLRERHLLAAYGEAWRMIPGARRRRRLIQARRSVELPPFGLMPPE